MVLLFIFYLPLLENITVAVNIIWTSGKYSDSLMVLCNSIEVARDVDRNSEGLLPMTLLVSILILLFKVFSLNFFAEGQN